MSSPPRSAIFGSSVFRIAFVSTLLISTLLVAGMAAISLGLIWQIERADRSRILDAANDVRFLFKQAGTPGLIDYFAPDGMRIRDENDLAIAKSEGELFGVLRGQDFAPMAGLAGLYADLAGRTPSWTMTQALVRHVHTASTSTSV